MRALAGDRRRAAPGPTNASMSDALTMPGRSSTVVSPATESTVDSIPTLHVPPSRIMSTALPNDTRTCSAVTGESSVNRLALGAAMGNSAARRSSRATGCAGMRNPTVSSPAVTMPGIMSRLRTTSVSGPGQKARARISARSGHSAANSRAISSDATCTIKGLVVGLPLASKIRFTAIASSAFAPRP